jgi:germination protein M
VTEAITMMTARKTLHALAALTLTLAFAGAACDGDDTSAPSTPNAPSTTTPAPTTVTTTTVASTTVPDTTTPVTSTTPATTAPPTSTTTSATTSTTAAATTAPVATVDVRVYFLRDERLVVAHRQVAGPAVLRGALEALLAGPTAAERLLGDTSTVPPGTTVRGVDLDDGEATVDLTAEFGSGGGSLSMTARVAQVVFTATQFPNVDRVTFWIDGEPVDALGGEGLILDEPQRRMDMARDLTGSVIIDSPHPGDTVTSPIRVTGEGDVYEAQFPIEIWRDGVQVGGLAPVTAGAWGTWGPFDVEIPADVTPGPLQIVAYDAGGCGTDPECPPIIRTVVDVVLAA